MTFEDHVRGALDELPPHIAEALRNVAVVVEEENPEDPDLFGLYHGVPLPERGDMAGTLPDKISIYRIPLEESFPDPDELRAEIRIPFSTSSATTSGSTKIGSRSSGTSEVWSAVRAGMQEPRRTFQPT